MFFAVFGEKTNAKIDGFARGVDHHRFTIDFNHSACRFPHAEDQLRQFGTSGTHQSGEANNFAGTHQQATRLDFAAVGQEVNIQAGFTERDIALFIEQIAQWPADHHPHQLPGIEVIAGQAANVLPVAQHADAIGKLIHFRHTVADVDNRHPFIAQPHNQFKQTVSFTGGEGSGGFVHHQNAAVAM